MKYFLFAVIFGLGTIAFPQTKSGTKTESAPLLGTSENTLKIDSLIRVLPNATSTGRFDILFQLFGRYINVDIAMASCYLDSCIILSTSSNDSLWMVKTGHAKGFLLRGRGDLKGAIHEFESVLVIAERNKYLDQVKYILNSLAIAHTLSASFDKALQYNFESLGIREAEGNISDISTALNNIGLVYDELEDFENALVYYERSYKLKSTNNIKYDLERTLVNIGGILNQLNRYKEAEEKTMEVFEICGVVECRPDIIAQANLVLGISMVNQEKYHLGDKYLMRSLELQSKLEDSDRMSLNYHWLAKLRYMQNETSSALIFLEKSQKIAKRIGLQKRILANYILYANIYSGGKDFERAYLYQKSFNELNAEIINGDLVRKISAVQSDFRERENTAKISSQAEVMRLQMESIKQHQQLNVLIGLMVLLMIVIIWILFKSNRQKQQNNEKLDRRVRERTFELEKNRDELQHAHDEQRLVLTRVSGDLVSSLATFKGLSNVAVRELPSDQAIYFIEAEATAERILGYVRQYSAVNGAIDLNKQAEQTENNSNLLSYNLYR